MKISLKNIAKVAKADIEINGITVIAGANNTGKSTVGKALYALFIASTNLEKQTSIALATSIGKVLDFSSSLYQGINIEHITKFMQYGEEIIKNKNNIKEFSTYNDRETLQTLRNFLAHRTYTAINDCSESEYSHIVEEIKNRLALDINDIKQDVITKEFIGEFKGQINNIYKSEFAEVSLVIQNKKSYVQIQNNKVINSEINLNLTPYITYLDDPNIFDNLTSRPKELLPLLGHAGALIYRFLFDNNEVNSVDKRIIENKLEEVNRIINTTCTGNLYLDSFGFLYKENTKALPINIENLSVGLKTFAILKALVEKGFIKNKGTIILDEPEIHLHPEWQLVFAELLVLLQKTFNLHILLNTHSPYFLRAIQVYSAKHEIADKCKYYLSRLEGDGAYIDDVSDDIEKIFKSLARPLQTLRNEEL